MNASINTYILLALSIASLLANWRGVNANYTSSYISDIRQNITCLQVEAPPQISSLAKSEKEDFVTPQSDIYSELAQTQSQFNQQPRDEKGLREQWALERIQALLALQTTKNNSQILVAVLDTGIDQGHEDLFGRVIADINFTESATTRDIYGHGTHLAGIIAANGDNRIGIIGLASESRLLNVKVVDDNGRFELSALANGIIWAVDNGAKVVNISMELREHAKELKEAVDYAWNKGAIVIAAAGNDGSGKPVYPAFYGNCIAVTAIRENGNLAPLANCGDWVDVAAPGFNIYSTLPNNSYGYKHGTSFAAAYVSGLAAILFPLMTDVNSNGNLNDEVIQAIYAGCQNIGIAGTGRGLINVASSLYWVNGLDG